VFLLKDTSCGTEIKMVTTLKAKNEIPVLILPLQGGPYGKVLD
jgi:hypothetical protein